MEWFIFWAIVLGYTGMGLWLAIRMAPELYRTQQARYKYQPKEVSMREGAWMAVWLGFIWPVALPVFLIVRSMRAEETKAKELERAQKIVDDWKREQKEKEEREFAELEARPTKVKRLMRGIRSESGGWLRDPTDPKDIR